MIINLNNEEIKNDLREFLTQLYIDLQIVKQRGSRYGQKNLKLAAIVKTVAEIISRLFKITFGTTNALFQSALIKLFLTATRTTGNLTANWNFAKSYLDFLTHTQFILKQGTPKVDLAIYYQNYYETINFIGSKKIFDDGGILEQHVYSYDFLSHTALKNLSVKNSQNQGCL